jgi:hypothetical protein
MKGGKQTNDPLSLFEFFHENHRNTTRERMLDFFKSSRDFDELAKLPNEELLLVSCERHVGAVMRRSKVRKS